MQKYISRLTSTHSARAGKLEKIEKVHKLEFML